MSRFLAQIHLPRGPLGIANEVRRAQPGSSQRSDAMVTRSGGGSFSRASLRAIQSSPKLWTPHCTRWPSRCRASWMRHAPKPLISALRASRSRWPSAIAGSARSRPCFGRHRRGRDKCSLVLKLLRYARRARLPGSGLGSRFGFVSQRSGWCAGPATTRRQRRSRRGRNSRRPGGGGSRESGSRADSAGLP